LHSVIASYADSPYNEPIMPKGFILSSIGFVFYFRVTKNTEETEAKPDGVRPPDEKRPRIKSRQN